MIRNQPTASLVKHFEDLPHPRSGNAKAHMFLEILIIAILAVIWGAEGWSDVKLFGKNKKGWLKTFLCYRTFETTKSKGKQKNGVKSKLDFSE